LSILPDDKIAIKANLRLQELWGFGLTAGLYPVQGSIHQGISGSQWNTPAERAVRRSARLTADELGVRGAKEKAGIPDDSSLCETGFHLEDILQTYKISTASPKPRCMRRKELLIHFQL